MNDLVGIIRRESEIKEALERLAGLRERAAVLGVEGHRQFNPGWHLALDLRNMLAGMRVRRARRPGARGEPGRSHPGGPSRHGPEVARRQPGLPVGAEGERVTADPAAGADDPPGPAAALRPVELGKYLTPDELLPLDDAASPGGPR